MTKPLEQNVYKNVVETIRDTLDIKDVKQKIVEVVGSYLNADRCFILEYDNAKDCFLKVVEEYRSSPDILGYIGTDINENIPKFASEFKKGKSLILSQEQALLDGKEFDLNDGSFEAEKIAIEKYKVYAALVFPLYYLEDFLGDLVIHYTDKKHKMTEDEINFLEIVSNQIAIAIHQGKIYSELQDYAKEEKNILEVVQTIRNTIGVDETKNTIVNIVGKVLEADRCFLTDFDEDIDGFLPIEYEYLSSNKSSSFIGQDVHEITPNFIQAIKAGKYLLVQNRKIFLDTEEQFFEVEQETIEKFDVNSAFSIPLFYKKRFLGVLTIQYIDGEIGNFEIHLMKHIANQVAIALFQAKMYEKVNKDAERQRILGQIIIESISGFEFKNIANIVNEIGKLTKSDRCYFSEVDDDESRGLITEEYLSSDNITSIKGKVFVVETLTVLKELFLKNMPLVIDFEHLENLPEKASLTFKQYNEQANVKIGIGIPFFYLNKFTAMLVIEYITEKVVPTQEDLNFLGLLGNQVGIAFNQTRLYKITKQKAEREELLREITEKIRSSLDIEKTLTFVCEEISEVFNAQRVSVIDFFDKNNYENWIVRKEYKKNVDIKGLNDVNFPKSAGGYNGRTILKEGKNLIIDNIEEADLPEYYKEAYRNMGIKSILSVPIKSDSDEFGIIFISITDKYRKWSNEDVELLELISVQIHIAIRQAELYEEQKLSVERERISRNIIEILRSSIDKTIIKKLFVKNIGKFFNADRVFFSEYDSNEKIFMPIDKDAEYLSSPNEMSFVGIDLHNKASKDYYNALLEKREMKIFSVEDYIKEKQLSDEDRYLMEEGRVKSSYSFPIIYQGDLLGDFTIEFTQNHFKLSDEDINRIRNMCTQAGIALYHAEILSKAQELATLKTSCIKSMTEAINEFTDNLTKLSDEISKAETKCENCNLYLNYLNEIVIRISNFIKDVQSHAD